MDKTTDFVTTIQKNQALLYKVAGFYVDNLHDREDLVQEIIYQLWRSYDSFNNKASITTWMYRVAMNTSIWFIKKKRRSVVTQSMDKITLDYQKRGCFYRSERQRQIVNCLRRPPKKKGSRNK